MYAYRQQTYERPLRAVPARHVRRPVHVRKKPCVKKKQNIFVEFIRLVCSLTFLSVFIVFVYPTAYNGLVKNVLFPTDGSTAVEYRDTLDSNNFPDKNKINLCSIMFPTSDYLYNSIFNNQVLLTPTLEKTHSELSTMYQTSEIAPLKAELETLMGQYPAIEPAIYVWEYEQGNYININADEQYPAASIIKLPVLVRMFKSIEANQFTIYDEMMMLEQYRSTGSGNLQYGPAGKKYTMDYLAKTMIEDSDNTSTNMIMAKLGGMNDVNSGLRDWGISKTYVRTWLPDMTGTNKTTALDVAKILYNLDNPGFLNINSRESIIDYMSHVKNDRLIQAGLGEGALFIHKTGDIGTMLGDAGIVYAPNGKKYIVVILAHRPYNSTQGKDFIVKASQLIYKAIVE